MSDWPRKIRRITFLAVKELIFLTVYAIIAIGFISLSSVTPYFKWKSIISIILVCVAFIPLRNLLYNLIFKKPLLLFGKLIGLEKEDFRGTKYYKVIQDYENRHKEKKTRYKVIYNQENIKNIGEFIQRYSRRNDSIEN